MGAADAREHKYIPFHCKKPVGTRASCDSGSEASVMGFNSFSKTEVVESFCFDGIARIFPIAGVIWQSDWPYRELDTLRLRILQLDLSFVLWIKFPSFPVGEQSCHYWYSFLDNIMHITPKQRPTSLNLTYPVKSKKIHISNFEYLFKMFTLFKICIVL